MRPRSFVNNLLLLVLAVLVDTTCIARPSAETMDIKLVFPETFRGAVVFKFGKDDGADLVKDKGAIVINIETDGVMEFKGENLFNSWHSICATFADGTPMPVHGRELELAADEVGFRSLGSTEEGSEAWSVVGDAQDAKLARMAMHGYSPDDPLVKRLMERGDF